MLELLISLGAVIMISAMCSLLEAVFLSTPVSHVEKLASEGNESGRIFRELRLDVDRPLTAILSLNTIANTGGAAVAGAAFVKAFGESLEVYFTLFITLSVLILSEVIPKTIGAVYNRVLAPLIARPLKILVFVFAPVIAFCRLITRTISQGNTDPEVSGDELIILAKLGHRIGTLEAGESHVIQNILRLKTKTAKEVMTPRTVVYSMHERQTVKEALGQGHVIPYSRIPVYADNVEDIVGIVLRGEAIAAFIDGKEETVLFELMRPAHFVLETNKLDKILEMFLELHQHMLVAVDEFGGIAGIITLEDVLEEILGKEIVDELDEVVDMRTLARQRRRSVTRNGKKSNP